MASHGAAVFFLGESFQGSIAEVVPPPPQDASHHQDYYTFRIRDPNLNLHFQLLLENWMDTFTLQKPGCFDEDQSLNFFGKTQSLGS